MSNNNVLTIPITEITRRKLAALAILTGKKFDSIESEMTSLLEEAISTQLEDAIMGLDGGNARHKHRLSIPTPQRPKSFADAEQRSQHQIEAEEDVVDGLAGHSLSGDEDEGAPSLEEQVQNDTAYTAAETQLKAQPVAEKPPRHPLPAQPQVDDLRAPDFDFPKVEGNSEAFLDAALSTSPAAVQHSRRSAPSRSFNPETRKARVSEYTDEETGDSTNGDIF